MTSLERPVFGDGKPVTPWRKFWRTLALAFRVPKKPCDCHACNPTPINRSNSSNVSHGLHLWICTDGRVHYRAKSRVVRP